VAIGNDGKGNKKPIGLTTDGQAARMFQSAATQRTAVLQSQKPPDGLYIGRSLSCDLVVRFAFSERNSENLVLRM
jgi:hypothetical protein